MIFYYFKDSLTRQKCVEILQRISGNQASSNGTVKRRYSEFYWKRVSLGDEYRQGRPATAVTDKNTDAVRRMIENENRTTYDNKHPCALAGVG